MIAGMRYAVWTVVLGLAASAAAQTITSPPSTAHVAKPTITAVTGCHNHGTVLYCMSGESEWPMKVTKTEEFQAQYTDCHNHGVKVYCVDDKENDVEVLVEESEGGEEENPGNGERHCHFHSGVEHCVGGGESEHGPKNCAFQPREYNIPIRIGLLFVILVTSALGVFTPIIITSFTKWTQASTIFVILRQFGTGVVLSTALVHLYTHATLMFANECLGELLYEGVTSAIVLAGVFLSFLIDYLGARFIIWKQGRNTASSIEDRASANDVTDVKGAPATPSGTIAISEDSHGHGHGHGVGGHKIDEKLSVAVLEAGIVFHSILIGVTLVVAGDSYFLTLFAVIVFHQIFEGIALGSAIAGLPDAKASIVTKLVMGTIFALITPLGMAIGIGVLKQWNGNDPSTIVAVGTLDAISAGILLWVGIVELLARDWLHGQLLTSGPLKTGLAMFALISGMVLMSFLGKWA
ncbi:ZIP zinc transporter-domain-containing protein [Dendryphion nanum]|uniref:ZIP zinc transporter-domain-containing protein n=1 Tax=Dendryphion nanum TaxID=256645 RepID=A0A9P9E339_9PLEO|nr:ZIP zinc transporter-domain-containing protein [Dendryphion nanum]